LSSRQATLPVVLSARAGSRCSARAFGSPPGPLEIVDDEAIFDRESNEALR
jgi:hypothetical protein